MSSEDLWPGRDEFTAGVSERGPERGQEEWSVKTGAAARLRGRRLVEADAWPLQLLSLVASTRFQRGEGPGLTPWFGVVVWDGGGF